jgi:hypothetical protein
MSLSPPRRVLLVTAALALAACPGGAGRRESDRTLITHTRKVVSEKRGVEADLTYEAELWEDPEDPESLVGIGHYRGKEVFHTANCHSGYQMPPYEAPVEGNLEASAGLGLGRLVYTLATTDWRLMPFVLDAGLYGESEYSSYYADSPEELEMVAGSGSVSSGFFGVALADGPLTEDTETTVTEGGDCTGKVTTTVTRRIEVVPADRVLRAVPDVSLGRLRGEVFTLDGSRSTPRSEIQSYRWELAPSAACPPGVKTMTYTGPKVDVQLLCDMEATLTVSTEAGAVSSSAVGGVARQGLETRALAGKSDTKKAHVKVGTRPWKTRFSHQAGTTPLVNKPLYHLCAEGCFFGRNVCQAEGLKGAQSSHHFIHSLTVGPEASNEAFELKQVEDPDSPVHGWWYMGTNLVAVKRASLLNADLGPQGRVYAYNKAFCTKTDCPVDLLVEQITTHERLHSTLLKEALDTTPKADAAKELEPLMGPDRTEVWGWGIQALGTAEDLLFEATTDSRVVAKMKAEHTKFDGVSIQLHLPTSTREDTGWAPMNIPNLAELGE